MWVLSETIDDPTLRKVVRSHFGLHAIAWEQADAVHAHLAGQMAEDGVTTFEFYAERSGGE